MSKKVSKKLSMSIGTSAVVSLISAADIIGLGSSAFAAGLEKTITWSGKYAGMGGAATAAVEGPESLFFNPAGLGRASGLQTSLNLSPTFVQFTAPIQTTFGSATSITSDRSLVFPGAAIISYGITPQLGVAIGYYISGGTRTKYENVTFAFSESPLVYPTFTTTVQSDLTLSELSAGVGYEIIDGLRIGASYRILFVKGTVGSVLQSGGTIPIFAAATLQDLSATRWNGFRAGIQYSPTDANWGFGAQWRSAIGFTANGNLTGVVAAAEQPTTIPITSTPGAIGTSLPYQISLGGFYDIMPKTWRFLIDYAFTNYQTDRSLGLSGTILGQSLSSLPLNGNNSNVFRFGTEYRLMPTLAVRAGYVYTSQITPPGAASPIYPTPGYGNTYTVGAGMTVIENLEANLAFEYSYSAGKVTAADAPLAPGTSVGNYSSNAIGIHAGVSYKLL